MSLKYRAWAYIGVYELADLGVFHTEVEALAELHANITAQLLGEPDCEHEGIYEAFWADSKIVVEAGP